MSDFLYGIKDGEELFEDIGGLYECYEDCSYLDGPSDPDWPESLTIVRWDVEPRDPFLWKADRILDHIADWYQDDCGDEVAAERISRAIEDPEVIAAFTAARDVLEAKIAYKWAKSRAGEHTITWDADGEPLLDGEQLYRKVVPCPADTDGDGDCAMCAKDPTFHQPSH